MYRPAGAGPFPFVVLLHGCGGLTHEASWSQWVRPWADLFRAHCPVGPPGGEPLALMQGTVLRATIPGYSVRQATEGDLAVCNRVCTHIHGHDRSGELCDAITQATATVVEHDGRITGYATAIGFFAHAVGESNEALKALIGAATAYLGPGFLLPTRNTALFRWCLEHGLRVGQVMTLMSTGLYNEPAGAYLPSILY